MSGISEPPVPPMSPLPPAPPAAPVRRGLRWLLIASLGVNLLVAGVVVGNLVSGPMGRREPSVELALGPFARALDPADRRAIARDLLERADLRDLRRAERQADLTALAAILRTEPFDREAVAAMMQAQREKVRTLEAEVEAALLDRLVEMTPAERTAFADRIEAEAGHDRHGAD